MSVLVLSVMCTGYADVVIGDWENGSYDSWIDWGAEQATIESIGEPKYSFSATGATLGSTALKMSPGSGWQQNLSISLADIGGLEAFMSGTAFAIDVTYNSADWDPATTYAQVYQVSFNNNGFGWHDVGGAGAPTGAAGVVFTDTLNPDSPGAIPLIDPGVEGTTMTGTWTWDYSGVLDQFTLPDTDAYIQIVIATNSDAPGAYYFDNARIVGAEPPKPGPKVIFVTSIKDNNLDGVQDDISWYDWLTEEGYDVDFRPGNWIDPLDDAKIAELEAADLIIASRGMATGEYDGDETAKWNGLSTPIICTNAWMIRSNRWVWMNSTAANKDADSPFLLAIEPTHPIFEGVALDADGLAEILDPAVGSGNTSFLNDILDVGNGTLIAQSLGIYNTTWIAEWAAGVEYYEGAGQIAGGPRILFMAGTQDDPYTDENGNIMPVGVLNLNDEGRKLFLNAIEYLLPAKLTHSYTFNDGTAADSVGGADGTLVGDDIAIVDGSLVVDGDGDFMDMPGDVIAINTYSALTLELWCTQSVDNPFSMTASFGSSWDNGTGKDYIMIATGRGDQMNRGAIANTPDDVNPWEDEVGVSSPELNDGIEHQYVLTVTAAELAYYVDGALIGTAPMGDTTIAGLSNDLAYLGKGVYPNDGTMNCSINEFNIYDKALSAGQVAADYAAGPAKVEPEGPSTEGLLAYYALEGDVLDSSGNGFNGTIVGDPIYVDGAIGMGMDFNGDDYIDCGNDEVFSVTDYLTVALWVNIRTIPTAWTGAITKGNTAWRISNYNLSTGMHFGFENGSRGWQAANSATQLNIGEWYHVCGVYDINVGAKIYIDGLEDGSNADTGGITQNTSIVAIGTNSDSTYPEQAWDGLLDEVMIFNRALSADEVAALAGQ